MAIGSWLSKLKLDYNKAYELAIVSKLCYLRTKDNKIDVESILKGLKEFDNEYYLVKEFDKNSSQGIIAHHAKYNVIGFSGTEEIKDWLDNALIAKIDMFGGEIHKGFYYALKDIWQEISDYWETLDPETREKPLYGAGHSLGGSLLTNTIALGEEVGMKFERCYTFGQPKVGDGNFARTFNSRFENILYRFHNDSDIVPLLPSVLLGYVDCGCNVYINPKGKINFDKNVSIIEQTFQHLKATFYDLASFDPNWVGDHHIDRYIEAIDKLRVGG